VSANDQLQRLGRVRKAPDRYIGRTGEGRDPVDCMGCAKGRTVPLSSAFGE